MRKPAQKILESAGSKESALFAIGFIINELESYPDSETVIIKNGFQFSVSELIDYWMGLKKEIELA